MVLWCVVHLSHKHGHFIGSTRYCELCAQAHKTLLLEIDAFKVRESFPNDVRPKGKKYFWGLVFGN